MPPPENKLEHLKTPHEARNISRRVLLRLSGGQETALSLQGKGAAMPFSSKAREIHDHIVSAGKDDHWIAVARSLVEREGQHQPGRPYSRNIHALRDKLQAELSSAVTDANDHHWEEIAHWLVYEARRS